MRYLVSALLGALLLASLWGGYERWQHTRWRDYAKALERASAANLAATKALRSQELADYESKADATDERYRAALVGARAKSARHIAANRVQSSGSSPAQPISQTGDTGSPERTDPQALVAVTADDVEICTTNTLRLEEARAWALGL